MSFGGLFNLARQGISKPSGQAGDHSFSSTALSLMCPWQHQFSFDGAGHARSPGRPPHRVHRAASRALPRAGAAGPTPHPPSPGVAAGARLLNRHTGRAATCAAAARHARRAPSKTHRGGGVERDGSRRQAALPRPLLPPNTVMGSGEWSEKPSPAWTDRRGAVSKQEEEVSSYAPRGLHHPPTHPPPLVTRAADTSPLLPPTAAPSTPPPPLPRAPDAGSTVARRAATSASAAPCSLQKVPRPRVGFQRHRRARRGQQVTQPRRRAKRGEHVEAPAAHNNSTARRRCGCHHPRRAGRPPPRHDNRPRLARTPRQRFVSGRSGAEAVPKEHDAGARHPSAASPR